jgi:hypothetical protein
MSGFLPNYIIKSLRIFIVSRIRTNQSHHKVIANFHCQPDSDQPNCPDPNILIYSLQSNRTKMASDDSHLKNLEQWIVEEKKIVRLRRTENAHTDRPHRVPYPSNASFFSSFPFR